METENRKKFEWKGDWHPCEEMEAAEKEKEYEDNQMFKFALGFFILMNIACCIVAWKQ